MNDHITTATNADLAFTASLREFIKPIVEQAVTDALRANLNTELQSVLEDSYALQKAITRCIDYAEIAANIDTSDVASHLSASDYADIADNIDVKALAENVTVDTEDVVENINYRYLATEMVNALSRR